MPKKGKADILLLRDGEKTDHLCACVRVFTLVTKAFDRKKTYADFLGQNIGGAR